MWDGKRGDWRWWESGGKTNVPGGWIRGVGDVEGRWWWWWWELVLGSPEFAARGVDANSLQPARVSKLCAAYGMAGWSDHVRTIAKQTHHCWPLIGFLNPSLAECRHRVGHDYWAGAGASLHNPSYSRLAFSQSPLAFNCPKAAVSEFQSAIPVSHSATSTKCPRTARSPRTETVENTPRREP